MKPLDYYQRLCPSQEQEEPEEVQMKPYFPTEKISKVPEPTKHKPMKVRTRIQLTLKIKGINITGSTANFSVRGENAINILNILQPLKRRFPKSYNPQQIVRVQLTEYKEGCGSYRPEKGGNINLHNTSVENIKHLILAILDEHGLVCPQEITSANNELENFIPETQPIAKIELKRVETSAKTSANIITTPLASPSAGQMTHNEVCS